MSKRKICVVTGTRADYGLLYWLMKGLQDTVEFELQVAVTGMHLSETYGMTWTQVKDAGFPISTKVEIDLSSDTPEAITKQLGQGICGFASAFANLQPDLVIVLGDRYEALAAASAACIACIPIAHLHGGETTEGAFDEAFRHSITKMSQLHFTSAEVHRQRVIQLGEHPTRAFNVGAMGLDNIEQLDLLEKEEFESSIDFKLRQQNILVTFHPVTLEKQTSQQQFEALLEALKLHPDLGVIFTKPNSDTGNRVISEQIDVFVEAHPSRCVAHTSLGQLRYLSALKLVDAVVGNSSSGLIEVPAFTTATVNIGDRQKGRLAGSSVIHCEPDSSSIFAAINTALSDSFLDTLDGSHNPYGKAGAAQRVIAELKSYNFSRGVKKSFFDLPQPLKNP